MKKSKSDRRFSLTMLGLLLIFMFCEITCGIVLYSHIYPAEYLLPKENITNFPQGLWIIALLLLLTGIYYIKKRQKKR